MAAVRAWHAFDVSSFFDLDAPFLTRQYRGAGGDPGRLRSKEYRHIFGSVWVRTAAFDHDSVYRAALLLHPPGAFLSHLSAATVHGLPVPDHPFIHVTVLAHEDRRYRPQIKPHVTGRKRELQVIRGMPVTDAVATFIDSAGMLAFVDLVVLGDAICRKYRLPAARLRAACAASSDYYANLARAAAAYVRDGVDSPMETRLRLLIVLSGLPEPEVNFKLCGPNGRVRRRFDLYYAGVRLIIEYDGRQHAEDTDQWTSDLARREELDDAGYRLIVVTARDIYGEPLRTLQRIRDQLVQRGYADVPAINDRWLSHFTA